MNSDWTVKVARDATKQLEKLDPQVARRILNYLRRLEADPGPTRPAKRLKGSLAMLSRYRIGDYRIICELNRDACTITVLRVAHRREVHRKSTFRPRSANAPKSAAACADKYIIK